MTIGKYSRYSLTISLSVLISFFFFRKMVLAKNSKRLWCKNGNKKNKYPKSDLNVDKFDEILLK